VIIASLFREMRLERLWGARRFFIFPAVERFFLKKRIDYLKKNPYDL